MAAMEGSKKRSRVDIFQTLAFPSVSGLKKLKACADPLIIIIDHPPSTSSTSSSWALEIGGVGQKTEEDQLKYCLKPSSFSSQPSEYNEKKKKTTTTQHPRQDQDQDQDQDESSSKYKTPLRNQPYKKYPSTNEKGWLETCVRLGVTRPLLCFNKRVTNTDADPNQHRFQLTGSEIFNNKSTQPALKELARKAKKLEAPNGVAVKVMDRMGHLYNMTFKYNAKTEYYRFMGADYSEFLKRTKLRADQRMDIYVLPDVRSTKGVDHWLAFLNSDPEDYNIDDEVEEEIDLPPLPHWDVKLF